MINKYLFGCIFFNKLHILIPYILTRKGDLSWKTIVQTTITTMLEVILPKTLQAITTVEVILLKTLQVTTTQKTTPKIIIM